MRSLSNGSKEDNDKLVATNVAAACGAKLLRQDTVNEQERIVPMAERSRRLVVKMLLNRLCVASAIIIIFTATTTTSVACHKNGAIGEQAKTARESFIAPGEVGLVEEQVDRFKQTSERQADSSIGLQQQHQLEKERDPSSDATLSSFGLTHFRREPTKMSNTNAKRPGAVAMINVADDEHEEPEVIGKPNQATGEPWQLAEPEAAKAPRTRRAIGVAGGLTDSDRRRGNEPSETSLASKLSKEIRDQGNSETKATQTEATNSNGQRHEEEPPSLKCRVEKNLYLDFEEYGHYTCANCYKKFLYRKEEERILLLDELSKTWLLPNRTELIRDTFKDESSYNKWRECCKQALDCCRRNAVYLSAKRQIVHLEDKENNGEKEGDQSNNITNHSLVVYRDDLQPSDKCHATWDGLSCWPDSPAGSLAKQDCPDYAYFLEFVPICRGQVSKRCFANGSWYIRNDHEWSDYSNCGAFPVVHHANRLLIGSVWHLVSAVVIGPALIVLRKLPNRGGSKRVRILSNLLFWLLLNGLLAATQKMGIVGKVFQAEKNPEEPPPPPPVSMGSQLQLIRSRAEPAGSGPEAANLEQVSGARERRSAKVDLWSRRLDSALARYGDDCADEAASIAVGDTPVRLRAQVDLDLARANGSSPRRRCKRTTSGGQMRARKRKSPPVVFLCWALTVVIKITRQLGYAWMFTGAVYLCSVLLFAPAEPPIVFIKWLMLLTNAFPVVIGLVYTIARTIFEPSPLTILVRLPYYYYIGDTTYVEYLWATQLDCWMLQSKYDEIEEIVDRPNLVLIMLNGVLFFVTIIIMCRINRPGSTRPEMSLIDYFRAAGTLVLLYGAHYALVAYRPPVEGCIKDQVFYYLFQFVDGIQGIAVSYVFCYRTPEGREIIAKWWSNRNQNRPAWCQVLFCSSNKPYSNNFAPHPPLAPSSGSCHKKKSREHGSFDVGNRSKTLSIHSFDSVCNGKDNTTELVNIHETPGAKTSKF